MLDVLAPTLPPHEVALLKRQAGTQPPAPRAAQPLINQIAQRDASKLAVQQSRERDAAAIVAFRDYSRLKATSPFAAAAAMNANAEQINTGRRLAAETTDPEPPQAA